VREAAVLLRGDVRQQKSTALARRFGLSGYLRVSERKNENKANPDEATCTRREQGEREI
jgi:hypothetical protein